MSVGSSILQEIGGGIAERLGSRAETLSRFVWIFHTGVTEIKVETSTQTFPFSLCSEDSEDKDVKPKKDDSHSAGN